MGGRIYKSLRMKWMVLKEEGVQTIVAFPLVGKGKVGGGITLLSQSCRNLSQREVRLSENIGNQVGLFS